MAGRMHSVFISSVPRVRALPGQGGVDGEVHARIEQEGVDAGLGDPVGVAGQVGRREGAGDPAQVLAVDAVGGEGAADQRR